MMTPQQQKEILEKVGRLSEQEKKKLQENCFPNCSDSDPNHETLNSIVSLLQGHESFVSDMKETIESKPASSEPHPPKHEIYGEICRNCEKRRCSIKSCGGFCLLKA